MFRRCTQTAQPYQPVTNTLLLRVRVRASTSLSDILWTDTSRLLPAILMLIPRSEIDLREIEHIKHMNRYKRRLGILYTSLQNCKAFSKTVFDHLMLLNVLFQQTIPRTFFVITHLPKKGIRSIIYIFYQF